LHKHFSDDTKVIDLAILDDLEGSLRTLLCQSCGIVAKVLNGTRGSAIVPLDSLATTSSYRLQIVTVSLSAAVWP